MTLLRLLSVLALALVAAEAAGIPFCAPGLKACGASGCYSELINTCEDGTCVSRLESLMTELGVQPQQNGTSSCLPFFNVCGSNYCAVGEICLSGVCQKLFNTSSSPPPPVGGSPIDLCTAARKSAVGCSNDNTSFQKVDCNKIGTAQTSSLVCLESKQFKCAVSKEATVSSCKEGAVVANALEGMANLTFGVLKPSNNSQPLLQPLLQGMANAVGNVTASMLQLNTTRKPPVPPAQIPSPPPSPAYSGAASTSSDLILLVVAVMMGILLLT